jgi:hypothetical protein
MVWRIAARAILVMRQREGLAAQFLFDAGGAGSTGGSVRDLPGDLFCDQEGNQPCVDPRLCERWFSGCEFVEAGKALHSLEGELDLPAKAVDREHVASRERIRRKRGREHDLFGRFETAWIDLGAAFLGVLEQAFLLGLRLFGSLM